MTEGPERAFAAEMGRLLGPLFPKDLGLAVSGGGDSMAMLHLAAPWARVMGIRLWPVTIDHGLRPESAAEAKMVAAACQDLGLPHATLRWEPGEIRGNLQDAARAARRDLIGRWRGVCAHILFAHTQDDQAETVLMRMARGSGVEGLSAMRPATRVPNPDPMQSLLVPGGPPWPPVLDGHWTLLRPLLGVSRAALRHYLRVLQIPFAEDPSNTDPRFDRVRMRALLGPLAAEGLGPDRLAATAAAMARAEVALAARAADVARGALRAAPAPGTIALDRDAFAATEEETRLRILAAALNLVASAPYRPRLSALQAAMDRWQSGGTVTLHGALLLPQGDLLLIAREAAAQGPEVPTGTLWDGRWRIYGPAVKGLRVRALGEAGLTALGTAAPRPRAAALALPGVWDGETLVACPPLGWGRLAVCELRPQGGLIAALLSH